MKVKLAACAVQKKTLFPSGRLRPTMKTEQFAHVLLTSPRNFDDIWTCILPKAVALRIDEHIAETFDHHLQFRAKSGPIWARCRSTLETRGCILIKLARPSGKRRKDRTSGTEGKPEHRESNARAAQPT